MKLGECFIQLERSKDIEGFSYPFIAELVGHVQTEIASKLHIPSPIANYAVIVGGIIKNEGDLVLVQEKQKLRYSLYVISSNNISPSQNAQKLPLIGIESTQSRFGIQGGRIWTTPHYFSLWQKEKQK